MRKSTDTGQSQRWIRVAFITTAVIASLWTLFGLLLLLAGVVLTDLIAMFADKSLGDIVFTWDFALFVLWALGGPALLWVALAFWSTRLGQPATTANLSDNRE